MTARRRRILVTPREIAGVAAGLQAGLEGEGLEVDVLLRWPHPFGYRHARSRSRLVRLFSRLVVEPYDAAASPVRRAASLTARMAFLALAAFRYDTVIYLGPDTLIRGGHDRRWLTARGVRTVTVFLGSEARPPYLDGAFARGIDSDQLALVRARTANNRERVRQAERDSTAVVNHPGTGQFHERAYVDWTALGFPTSDGPPGAPRDPGPRHERPRVLHAPSDPEMKGTDRIRRAVQELVASGVELDYVEVSGRPHAEVLAAVRDADLVVDQLYSDLLLPGLATEAVRQGTPVVVFGYAADLLAPLAERAGLSTGHYAHPDDLAPVLRRLVTDPAARAALHEDLQRAVTDAWSGPAVAARWARLVTTGPDPAWLNEPDATPYAAGCAVEHGRLVTFLRRYLDAHGPGGLGLDHAPRTRDAVLRLAGGSAPSD